MRLGKIAAISLFLIMLYVGMNEAKYKYCGVPLVRNVKVHRITASSGNSNYQPSFAKFGNVGWSPSKADLHPWLKIDLGDLYLVCGFKVQGCRDGAVETYVRRYRVRVSPEDNFWDSWNYIKPEFYAGKSAKEVAYSEAKERKVGRFVKIYPVSYVAKKSKHHSACMKVEIYGNPYLSNGQHVFVRSNWAVMTYEKMKIQAIVPHAHTVDVAKGNQLPQRRNYYPHFSEVIPQVEPLQTELRVNTCVIAPVKGQYFSGRVHEVKDGRYRIEMLLWANREKLWRAIRLFDCKREELQIVFSAWCEKIDFVARVNHKDRMLTGGQIVRIDSQLQFIKNVEGGLYQLSYHRKNMTIADFVSRKKVEPDKVVPGVTKLWVENYQGYLEPKEAPSVDTANWIRWRNVWYRENGDKPESCHIRELQKGQCCYSRIPFTVVRQNCAITYAWNGERCTDEDECITGMASCGLNALCANTPGFYKCFCSKGFTGNSPRTAPCNDVDECAKKICHKDAICKNTVGSFTCRCKKGFKGDGHKSCVDIDECKVPAGESPCEKYKHAHCKNLPGSFRCECKTGFQGSFKQCEDLDECSSNRHNCSTHADCANAMGSYNCNCKKGYTGDGTNCQDINECNDQTNEGKCHPSLGQCVDIPGGYKCECKEGYVGDGIKSCILANECELGIHSCHKEATCINTRKSYDCRCNKGFEGDGHSCKDIDECVKKDDYCGLIRDGIECVNTDGSYKCICAKGFTGDGKTCVNIDECKTGAHNCVKDAICTDIKGGFYCRCRKGFYGDPTKECQPESGCMKALPHCDVPRAICTTEGKDLDKEAFSCFCKSGFTGANSNCTDIDECVDADANKCSKDALCINTAGTYECRCKDGFIGDGFICSDVNECNNHTRCPENAMCVNMKGSFECRCKTGFYGQDPHKQCSDVDECSQNNKCGYSSQACVNTVGSFYCKCKHGFKNTSTQAKLTCEDIDECVVQEESCGTFHSITCKNTPGDYFCVCEDGFEFTRKKQKCEDINECDFVDYPCVNEATCINNVGGFECACPKGYHGNGKYFCDADSSTTNKADGSGVFSFMISVIIAMAMLSTQ